MWFQNSLFAALEGEADRLQVALGGLAGSPEEGYMLGTTYAN